MATHSWNLTGRPERRIRLLEWVHDAAGGSTGNYIGVEPFGKETDMDHSELRSLVEQLEHDDCLDPTWSLGSEVADVALTMRGILEVQEIREKRADVVARRIACRDGLLTYLYLRQMAGTADVATESFLTDPLSAYLGEAFTAREVDLAAGDLRDGNFIKGTASWGSAGPLRARIDAKGVECVEQYGGSTVDYGRRAAGGTVNNQANFFAPVTADNVAVGDSTEQHSTKSFAPASYVTLGQGILNMIPVLDLPADTRADVEAAARDVMAEGAKADPDADWLRSLLGRLRGLLGQAGAAAVAAVAKVAVDQALEQLPLPGAS